MRLSFTQEYRVHILTYKQKYNIKLSENELPPEQAQALQTGNIIKASSDEEEESIIQDNLMLLDNFLKTIKERGDRLSPNAQGKLAKLKNDWGTYLNDRNRSN